jgi:hypothetical protein
MNASPELLYYRLLVPLPIRVDTHVGLLEFNRGRHEFPDCVRYELEAVEVGTGRVIVIGLTYLAEEWLDQAILGVGHAVRAGTIGHVLMRTLTRQGKAERTSRPLDDLTKRRPKELHGR